MKKLIAYMGVVIPILAFAFTFYTAGKNRDNMLQKFPVYENEASFYNTDGFIHIILPGNECEYTISKSWIGENIRAVPIDFITSKGEVIKWNSAFNVVNFEPSSSVYEVKGAISGAPKGFRKIYQPGGHVVHFTLINDPRIENQVLKIEIKGLVNKTVTFKVTSKENYEGYQKNRVMSFFPFTVLGIGLVPMFISLVYLENSKKKE